MWTDDKKEASAIYLEQLIADGVTFNKQMWHGGVTSETLIKEPKMKVKKKPASIKQSLKGPTEPSARKQRRISSYFTRSSSNHILTNAELTEIAIQLTTELKQLRREMKRRKRRSHGRQSAFHTTLSRRKKSNAHPSISEHNNEVNYAL